MPETEEGPVGQDEQAEAGVEAQAVPADEVLVGSVDPARAALEEITPASTIGQPAGYIVEGERVVSLLFENTMPGYPGWHWMVTLSRADEGAEPNVLEAQLVPGERSLLAPDWVPWADRLAEYRAAQEALAVAGGADGDEADEDAGFDGDAEDAEGDDSGFDDESDDDDDSDDDETDDDDSGDDGSDDDDESEDDSDDESDDDFAEVDDDSLIIGDDDDIDGVELDDDSGDDDDDNDESDYDDESDDDESGDVSDETDDGDSGDGSEPRSS